MENIIFRKTQDKQGQISGIAISGLLVLENSQALKKEFLAVIDCLSGRVNITVSNTPELDISCIQLFVAFIKQMDVTHVAYQFVWNLDEDQKILLENVGLSNELFMNNSYV